MPTNINFSKTDIFQFAHESNLLLSYLSIEATANLWAAFFTCVKTTSTDEDLIECFSEIFSLVVTKVDLNLAVPKEQACMVKVNNRWVFLKDINDLNKSISDVYIFRANNEIESTSNISFYNLILANKHHILIKLFFISFFINAFALTVPLYFNAIYGRIIPAAAESSLWTLSLIALLCFFCELSLKSTKTRYSSLLMKEFNDRIQTSFYKDIVSARNHIDNNWGADKVFLSKEIKELNALLWGGISTNVLDLIFVFLFFIVVYIMSGILVLVPLFVFFIQLLIGFLFSKSEVKCKSKNHSHENLSELDWSYVSGFSKMFSALNYVRSMSEYYRRNSFFQRKQSQINIMYFIISIQNILLTIVAFYLIQNNELSIASLFAVIIISSRISQSTSSFVSSIPLLYQINEKIKFIKHYKSKLVSSPNERVVSIPFSLTLSNVSFGYHGDRDLFKNINLKLLSGEKVAFVGNSDWGKTSLLKLISGLLIPHSGDVSVIDSNGERANFDAIRNQVHYIAQEPLLYGDSLLSFLCSEKDYTDEQCKSLFDSYFMRWLPPLLKKGLLTNIIDFSYCLSLQKKQMLVFSRFLLTERKVWLFDSPTHLVDLKLQNLFIDEAKKKITPDTSLFLFTDNVDLLSLVDRVIAFNGGEIIFDGSKDVFLKTYTKNLSQ
ncbi:TPA: ATP-binding cassette domain-containing protein [Enterobacter asburiae]|nr:ABC-type lipopolysaccharide transporter PglK [Enterobacter asburiae]HEC5301808.1 ATP-binding cassette domain-containing protein [Enterobacter asburiae]